MNTISVVIPTYNRALLLPETLNAVLSQTRQPDDVIVVDDGSTDNTQNVLKRYGGQVRSIIVQNGGDLVARNIGLENARTDLVAFCDSDDLWEPTFLQDMSRQWRHTPGLTACYSNFRILSGDNLAPRTKLDDAPVDFTSGIRWRAEGEGVFEFPIVDRLVRFQPLFASCIVVSRVGFGRLGGWDTGVSRTIGCDFATALRLASAPPIGLLVRPLVQIRKHAGNISSDVERMNLGDALVLEHVLNSQPFASQYRDLIRRSIAERRAAAINSAFLRGDYKTFNTYYPALPVDLKSPKLKAKRAVAVARSFLGI